jgi:predicted dehydrogenase
MNLNPEEKTVGKENYLSAVEALDRKRQDDAAKASAAEPTDANRRKFLKDIVGLGIVSGAGLGAAYFGYGDSSGGLAKPLRVALIGSGDEGGVLIGAMNPKYIDCVAICDIRPFNIHRAFEGDWESETAAAARPGLNAVFGYKSREEAEKHIKVYSDYKKALADPNVEAIIIALPLFLHAPVAVDACKAGKHVLTEKLMAHNVAQCKLMARVADKHNLYLAVGHQRHYSVLYDNAVNMIQWGLLGEIHHIRAQWHRGNLPGGDSWQKPLPVEVEARDKEGKVVMRNFVEEQYKKLVKGAKDASGAEKNQLDKKVAQWKAWLEDAGVKANEHGYQDFKLPGDGKTRTALEELVRWRLFQRTGGGLMAELGSHQLDAASIFCSALRKDGKKAHPLSVHAVGGRHTFPYDRDAEDHVYCMFEFPGPGYDPGFKPGYYDPEMNYPDPAKGIPSFDHDPQKKIVVTYSSINGNGFGGYGEVVMGSKGTIVLEREQDVFLYKDSATTTKVGVKADGGGPTLDTQASGKGPALAKAAENQGPVSRGYREEMEHFAWCIRTGAPKKDLRCRPEVALGDAVIALATNVAIKNANSGKGGYLAFKDEWYDLNSDETPDGSNVKEENEKLGGGLS